MDGKLRIGSCSWKFPSWIDLVYPEGTERDSMLGVYAGQYDTVEVDQWFWSYFPPSPPVMPKPSEVQRYAGQVPSTFQFSIKLPNSLSLTHLYKKYQTKVGSGANPYFLSPDIFVEFTQLIEPLAPNHPLLMLQFEYLNKEKCASKGQFYHWLEVFKERISGSHPLGVECRNPRYFSENYFRELKGLQLFPVLLSGYYMDPVCNTLDQASRALARGDLLVIRLHGSEREMMDLTSGEQWNRVLRPMDEELEQLVPRVSDLLASGIDVTINVNNHYEGSAPLTIEKIMELLAQC